MLNEKDSIIFTQFEPFPELEPFPFRPDPPRPERKKSQTPTLRKPGKFVQGQFAESDYESDLESVKIAPRWAPPGSDTESEASGYKKVRPRLIGEQKKKQSKQKSPSPPSKFDKNPPQFDGPPRPEFKKASPPPVAVEPDLISQMPRKPSVTGTETTKRVQMEESTRFSKRFVTGNVFQLKFKFQTLIESVYYF